jgi:hypothetical protein
VYGYPESVFPPTDFHTATLVGEFIYVIVLDLSTLVWRSDEGKTSESS